MHEASATPREARYKAWAHGEFRVRKPLGIVLSVLIAALLTVDVVLLRELRHSNGVRASEIRSMALSPGATVPPIDGVTADGRPLTISYGGEERRDTLLLVFHTECPVCKLNWPRWESLASDIDGKRYRVVYANTSDSLAPAYVSGHHLSDSAREGRSEGSRCLRAQSHADRPSH